MKKTNRTGNISWPLRIFFIVFFGVAALVCAACLSIFVYTVIDGEPDMSLLYPGIFLLGSFALLFAALRSVKKKLQNFRPSYDERVQKEIDRQHKYYEQLDRYLQAGLIDRKEYEDMKERFLRQGAPEN